MLLPVEQLQYLHKGVPFLGARERSTSQRWADVRHRN